MKKLFLFLLLCLFQGFFFAQANLNVYEFDSAQNQQQFSRLIKELRCPKCQNNNLADSNAPLAKDIKNYVYRSVKKGKTDDEITEFLISRYGEFITYRPRNQIIWLLPTAIGVLALFVIVWLIGRKRKEKATTKAVDSVPSMSEIIRQYQEEKQK